VKRYGFAMRLLTQIRVSLTGSGEGKTAYIYTTLDKRSNQSLYTRGSQAAFSDMLAVNSRSPYAPKKLNVEFLSNKLNEIPFQRSTAEYAQYLAKLFEAYVIPNGRPLRSSDAKSGMDLSEDQGSNPPQKAAETKTKQAAKARVIAKLKSDSKPKAPEENSASDLGLQGRPPALELPPPSRFGPLSLEEINAFLKPLTKPETQAIISDAKAEWKAAIKNKEREEKNMPELLKRSLEAIGKGPDNRALPPPAYKALVATFILENWSRDRFAAAVDAQRQYLQDKMDAIVANKEAGAKQAAETLKRTQQEKKRAQERKVRIARELDRAAQELVVGGYYTCRLGSMTSAGTPEEGMNSGPRYTFIDVQMQLMGHPADARRLLFSLRAGDSRTLPVDRGSFGSGTASGNQTITVDADNKFELFFDDNVGRWFYPGGTKRFENTLLRCEFSMEPE